MANVSDEGLSELIEQAEKWLSERGVPHLLYSDPDTQLTPLEHRNVHAMVTVAFAALFGAVFSIANSVGPGIGLCIPVGLVLVALGVLVVDRWDRRRKGDLPTDSMRAPPPGQMNWALVTAIMATPLVALLSTGSTGVYAVVVALGGLAVLGMIAGMTPLGTVRIAIWASGHPVRELRQNAKVLVGALPLVLLTVALLALSDDLWIVATNLTTAELVWTLGLFLGLCWCCVIATGWARVGELNHSLSTWRQVRSALEDESHEAIRHLLADTPWTRVKWVSTPPAKMPLDAWARWNVVLVRCIAQMVQVILISLLMAFFFLAFGGLTVDNETLAAWNVEPQPEWLAGLKGQHLTVGALLAAVGGLSYAVTAALFSEQRELFFGELDRKITQRLAVRKLYRGLRECRDKSESG